MKYNYFVSYTHSSRLVGGIGFGNCMIQLDHEIKHINDTKRIAQNIARHSNLSNVTIMWFTLLEMIEPGDNPNVSLTEEDNPT